MVDTPEDNDVEGDEPLIEDIPPPNDIVEQPDNPPGEIPGVGSCCWTNDKTLCTRQVTRFIVVYANLYEIMAVPHYACMAVAICPLGCNCTPG